MNDNDIVKTLESIASESIGDCKRDCAFYNGKVHYCAGVVAKNALDLIKRKDEQILELQGNLKFVRGAYDSACKQLYELAKADAVIEFAERLKERKYQSSDWSHGEHPYVVEESDINEILEEMTEETP